MLPGADSCRDEALIRDRCGKDMGWCMGWCMDMRSGGRMEVSLVGVALAAIKEKLYGPGAMRIAQRKGATAIIWPNVTDCAG